MAHADGGTQQGMADRTPEWQAGIWNLDGPVATVDKAKQALAECGWWADGQPDPEAVDKETGVWMVWVPLDMVGLLEEDGALSITTTHGQIDIEMP